MKRKRSSSGYSNKNFKRPRGLLYTPYSGYGQSAGVSKRQIDTVVANYGRRANSYGRPETKYFDCGINAAITTAGTTWADTEVPCDAYMTSDGATTGAYTASALIPSSIGSGYGQIVGNKYNLKGLRVRGAAWISTLSDQPDINSPVYVRLILVMDTQCNGAQAQGEDIMQDMGALQENCFSVKMHRKRNYLCGSRMFTRWLFGSY